MVLNAPHGFDRYSVLKTKMNQIRFEQTKTVDGCDNENDQFLRNTSLKHNSFSISESISLLRLQKNMRLILLYTTIIRNNCERLN